MTTSNSNVLKAETEEAANALEKITEGEPDLSSREIEPQIPTFANRFIFFWLCCVIVLSTLAFGTVHTWSLSLFYCGAVLICLFWIADAVMSCKLRYSDSLLQLPLVGIFLIGVVQLLPVGSQPMPEGALTIPAVRTLARDPFATRMALIQIVGITIFFSAALAFIDSEKRLRSITRTIVIFGFLLAVFGLVQKISSPTKIYWLREPNQAFPFGPFVNGGHFGACMEMTLSLTLGVLFGGGIEKDQRVLYGFMATVMFVALVMTGSRAAFFITIFIVIALVFARDLLRKKRRNDNETKVARIRGLLIKLTVSLGIAMITITIILAITFAMGGSASVDRVFNYTEANNPTGGGRLHYWSVALQIFKENPLIGVGLEGFGVSYTKHDTFNGAERIERAHNDYLQVLTDTGIIGALLCLAFIFFLFRYCIERYKSSHDKFRRGVCLGALAGCFAVLLHSFVEFPLRTTSNALLFLVLVALATVKVHKETSRARTHRRSRRRRQEVEEEDDDDDYEFE
jgi:O-antigen ligase